MPRGRSRGGSPGVPPLMRRPWEPRGQRAVCGAPRATPTFDPASRPADGTARHHHAASGPAPRLSARRILSGQPRRASQAGLLSGGDSGDEARVRLPSHHPHVLRRSRGCGLRGAATGPFRITLLSSWPSRVCSRHVSPARAWARTPADPRPEREPAADHPVADAARVRALPGAAPHVPAMQADTAQVGRAAATRTDGGAGEPAGAHGSPSPLAAPRAVCSSPAISWGVRGSFPLEMSAAGANSST